MSDSVQQTSGRCNDEGRTVHRTGPLGWPGLFTLMPSDVSNDSQLTRLDIVLFAALLDSRHNEAGTARISHSRLARMCRASRSGVKLAVRRLAERGWIAIARAGRGAVPTYNFPKHPLGWQRGSQQTGSVSDQVDDRTGSVSDQVDGRTGSVSDHGVDTDCPPSGPKHGHPVATLQTNRQTFEQTGGAAGLDDLVNKIAAAYPRAVSAEDRDRLRGVLRELDDELRGIVADEVGKYADKHRRDEARFAKSFARWIDEDLSVALRRAREERAAEAERQADQRAVESMDDAAFEASYRQAIRDGDVPANQWQVVLHPTRGPDGRETWTAAGRLAMSMAELRTDPTAVRVIAAIAKRNGHGKLAMST